jgi:voltage-gated potassium channel
MNTRDVRGLLIAWFLELSWQGILAIAAIYATATWVVLSLLGEPALTGGVDFIYWLIITASTVGYGDYSPATGAGKLFVSLFVVPVGLGIFATTIGHLTAILFNEWKKGIRGMRPTHKDNHILVIGWNGDRTLKLLDLLIDERVNHLKRDIVLCVDEEQENPLPDRIGFVHVNKFNNSEGMRRANVAGANCIIIDTPSDAETMTTALFCDQQNAQAHIIAYFQDESLSELLKGHCPNVECMPSVSIEMMAKSAMDPGSSVLHHELLNAARGMTQYSTKIPKLSAQISMQAVFNGFKTLHDATIIAVAGTADDHVQVNPSFDYPLNAGDTLYYIAAERIHGIEWSQFHV